jgi:hypothetical protein
VDGVQGLDDVGRGHLGQEPDTPEVHPEHGGVSLGGDPRAPEERAVATERDDQVGMPGSGLLVLAAPPRPVL